LRNGKRWEISAEMRGFLLKFKALLYGLFFTLSLLPAAAGGPAMHIGLPPAPAACECAVLGLLWS
jgi:hypothetical protein